MQIDGFSVSTVYQHYPPQAKHNHHKIVKHDINAARRNLAPFVIEHMPHKLDDERRRLLLTKPTRVFEYSLTQPDSSGWANARDKVKTMAQLMTLTNPFNPFEKKDLPNSIFEDNLGFYAPGSYETNVAKEESLLTNYYALNGQLKTDPVKAACQNYINKKLNPPAPYACNQRAKGDLETLYGVNAVLYSNPTNNQKILFFRGTYGQGYGNMKNLALWFIIDKLQDTILNMWTTAGNKITSSIKNRKSSHKGIYDFALNKVGSGQVSTFMSNLLKNEADNVRPVEDKKENGYWPITKMFVRDILPATRDKTVEVTNSANHLGDSFYLAGHSQGGTRAQYTSMWLEKEDGMKYNTVTFGATGSQCSGNQKTVVTNVGTKEDMDLSITHDQVTNYRDIFDIYGFYDHNVGQTCTYGVTNQEQRPAHKYFSNIVGYAGSVLNGAGQTIGAINVDDWTMLSPNVAKDFAATRYYSHSAWAIPGQILTVPGRLKDDGTTDGGCVTETVIDVGKQCGNGNLTTAAKWFIVAMVFGISFGVLILCCCCCCCMNVCNNKKLHRKSNSSPSSPSNAVAFHGTEEKLMEA